MDAADAKNFVVGDTFREEVDGVRHQVDDIYLKVDRVKHRYIVTSLFCSYFSFL